MNERFFTQNEVVAISLTIICLVVMAVAWSWYFVIQPFARFVGWITLALARKAVLLYYDLADYWSR